MRTRPRPSLRTIARLLDAATPEGATDALVLLLDDPDAPDDLVLALRAIPPGMHPCDLPHLAAPGSCWAVGLIVHGRAHLLDEPDAPPQPVVTTYLVDRDGREVSLLRRPSGVTELPGPSLGRLPDLCRSVLAAATLTPPSCRPGARGGRRGGRGAGPSPPRGGGGRSGG